MAAAHGAKPGVVEMTNWFAEELGVESDEFGTVNDTLHFGIITRGFAVEVAGFVGIGDALDAGIGGIEFTGCSEPVADRSASFHDQRGIKEAGEIEVAIIFKAAIEFFRLIKAIGRATHMAKGIVGQVEGMAAGRHRA